MPIFFYFRINIAKNLLLLKTYTNQSYNDHQVWQKIIFHPCRESKRIFRLKLITANDNNLDIFRCSKNLDLIKK